MPADHTLGAVLSWRFPRQSLENAIELRQRLKSRGERDFADAYITVVYKFACSVEPAACHVLDKRHPSDLLKSFAQIIRVNVDGFRHRAQGKFLV